VLTETPEEEKLRIKQERLAAWKASREKAAAKAPGASALARHLTRWNPPFAEPPLAQTKPVSKAGATKAPAKSNGLPRSAVSARLGLPTKAATATGSRATATSMMMDDDADEGDAEAAKKAMFRPDEGESSIAVEGDVAAEGDAADESDDDELARDDATGVVEARKAAAAADAMDEDAKVEAEVEAEVAPTAPAPAPAPMEVDEDEDVDPLDAYMTGVVDEVKKVNAADRARGIYAPRTAGSKLGLDENLAPEPEEDKPIKRTDEEEIEATGLRTEDIMACVAPLVLAFHSAHAARSGSRPRRSRRRTSLRPITPRLPTNPLLAPSTPRRPRSRT
jgi:ATP-dependent RNA helicase DDX46/PRP5